MNYKASIKLELLDIFSGLKKNKAKKIYKCVDRSRRINEMQHIKYSLNPNFVSQFP